MKISIVLIIPLTSVLALPAVGELLGKTKQTTIHAGYEAEHVIPLHRNDHQHVESKVQKALRMAANVGGSIAKDGKKQVEDTAAELIQKVSPFSVGLEVTSAGQEEGPNAGWLPTLGGEQPQEGKKSGKHTKVSAVQLEALHDALHRHKDQESQGVSAMPLRNVMNSQYTGPISVGNVRKGGCTDAHRNEDLNFLLPWNSTTVMLEECHLEPQSQVWVIFDTGSTNLWIASDVCTKKPCREQGRGFYDHTKSNTFGKPQGRQVTLDVKFGTGELKGPLGEDDLHLGSFTVKKQRFGLIQEEMGTVFAQIPFEGILGLGFPSMSANGMKPLFDNIIDQQVLKRNEFAFYFNPEDPSRNAMFWGGVDPAFYEGDIKTFPVTQEHYWALDLHDLKVGKESLLDAMYSDGRHGDPPDRKMSTMEVDSKGEAVQRQTIVRQEEGTWNNRWPKVIVDSGTTYYTAEKGLYKELMNRIKPASCDQVNDESYPIITYTLMDAQQNLYDLTIPPHMYMVSDSNGKKCSPAFMEISLPKEYGPGMILGEVFMRHWYTVFSRGSGESGFASVGFAKAKHGDAKLEKRLDEITKGMSVPKNIGFGEKAAEEMSEVEKVTGIQQISESSVGLQLSTQVHS